MCHSMHLRPAVAKQPNLELKTRPKQLLGSLPLVITLPGQAHNKQTLTPLQYSPNYASSPMP